MKLIAAMIVCLFATLSYSAEIKVFDIPSQGMDSNVVSEFAVNKEMGRAWVTISTSTNMPDSDLGSFYRVKVEGLSYDATTKTVVLETEGQLVECGKVVRAGLAIFKNTRVKPTGNCKFKVRNGYVTVDDGFETRRVFSRELFIITK